MRTKILVIIISFIFLLAYSNQCFASTNELVIEEIKDEINNEIINEETEEQVIEENLVGASSIKGKMYIEKPTLNQSINTRTNGTNLNIVGWAVSNDLNAKLECLVDNQKMNVNFTRVKRRDVDNAVSSAYGGTSYTPNAGFSGVLDIHTIQTGNHTIKVRQLSGNNEVICDYSVNVNITNPPYVRKNVY